MTAHVRILGTGGYVPKHVITNERIVRAIPGWTAEQIAAKTGIVERRFLHDFDEVTGLRKEIPAGEYPANGVDMAEITLKEALANAGLVASDLDAIILLSATPDRLNFSHDAILLHQRFGCRPDTKAIVLDAGCGTPMYAMDIARLLVKSGECRRVAVIGTHVPSAYLNREVFTSTLEVGGKKLGAALTMYLFGDGAGTFILGESATPGFLSSYTTTGHSELMVRRGGGALNPPHPGYASVPELAYYVNGKQVALEFPVYMKTAIQNVLDGAGLKADQIDRYVLHQANKVIVEKFIADVGLPRDRITINMDKYGNLNAAATPLLLAEDVREGKIVLGSGQKVLFAAIGAGIHCGAHVAVV